MSLLKTTRLLKYTRLMRLQFTRCTVSTICFTAKRHVICREREHLRPCAVLATVTGDISLDIDKLGCAITGAATYLHFHIANFTF